MDEGRRKYGKKARTKWEKGKQYQNVKDEGIKDWRIEVFLHKGCEESLQHTEDGRWKMEG